MNSKKEAELEHDLKLLYIWTKDRMMKSIKTSYLYKHTDFWTEIIHTYGWKLWQRWVHILTWDKIEVPWKAKLQLLSQNHDQDQDDTRSVGNCDRAKKLIWDHNINMDWITETKTIRAHWLSFFSPFAFLSSFSKFF